MSCSYTWTIFQSSKQWPLILVYLKKLKKNIPLLLEFHPLHSLLMLPKMTKIIHFTSKILVVILLNIFHIFLMMSGRRIWYQIKQYWLFYTSFQFLCLISFIAFQFGRGKLLLVKSYHTIVSEKIQSNGVFITELNLCHSHAEYRKSIISWV